MNQENKSLQQQEESTPQVGQQEDLFKMGLEKMLKQKLSEEEVNELDLALSGLRKESQE